MVVSSVNRWRCWRGGTGNHAIRLKIVSLHTGWWQLGQIEAAFRKRNSTRQLWDVRPSGILFPVRQPRHYPVANDRSLNYIYWDSLLFLVHNLFILVTLRIFFSLSSFFFKDFCQWKRYSFIPDLKFLSCFLKPISLSENILKIHRTFPQINIYFLNKKISR